MKNFLLYSLFAVCMCSANILQAQDKVTSTSFEDGDIICSDQIQTFNGDWRKSKGAYDASVIGVYLTPQYRSDRERQAIAKNPIRKSGIVLVKVNDENGQIKKGDAIASSSVDGEGMKATTSGIIVGIAVEDAPRSGKVKTRIMIQYVR